MGFSKSKGERTTRRGAMGYVVEQVMTHEAKGAKKPPWMDPQKEEKQINK
jgi:hypothetical protein